MVIEATYGWSLRHELAHRHMRAPGGPRRRDVLCARSVRIVWAQTADLARSAPVEYTKLWLAVVALACGRDGEAGCDWCRVGGAGSGRVVPARMAWTFGYRAAALVCLGASGPSTDRSLDWDAPDGGGPAFLTDNTLGAAMQTTVPAGTAIAPTDLRVQFLRPVATDGALLTARASVLHRGRSFAAARASHERTGQARRPRRCVGSHPPQSTSRPARWTTAWLQWQAARSMRNARAP